MFNNIFSKRVAESATIDFKVNTSQSMNESFNDTELHEFLMVQESIMSQAVLENVRHMYLGEKEDCVEIVQESASDYLNKMVEFFKKLIAKVKEWFGKIFLLIQTLIGNTGKMLEQNKATFLKKNASFDLQGYEYSIKDTAPNMEPIDKLVTEYNKEIANIRELKVDDIIERRSNFKGQLHKFRGQILTSNESIEDGEFREACDAFFRKGDKETQTITVGRAYIERIASDYNIVKKTYDESVKQKRQLEVQLESLKKFFENGARQVKFDSTGERVITTSEIERKDTHVKRTGEGTQHVATTSTLKLLNTYFNFRYEQSKELSSMVITVLESKVRALKEQLKFYDNCVRKWITVPNNSVNGVVEDNDDSSKSSKKGAKDND